MTTLDEKLLQWQTDLQAVLPLTQTLSKRAADAARYTE